MKKYFVITIISLFFMCIAFVTFYIFFFQNNIGSHPIDNIKLLLLNKEDLPNGWNLDFIEQLRGNDNWGIDNSAIVFKTNSVLSGGARENIYRFNNIYASKYSYFLLENELLTVKENKYSFLSYQSQVANDWHFLCDYNNFQGPRCEALGRYEDYIVFFGISADPYELTSNQLKHILEVIDIKMKEFLKK